MANSQAVVMSGSQLEPVQFIAKGEPMETLKQGAPDAASFGSSVVWHFRALPEDVQRVTIRRLALSGLNHEEIALRTGLSQEAVRHAISQDECLRTFVQPVSASGWLQLARSVSANKMGARTRFPREMEGGSSLPASRISSALSQIQREGARPHI